MPELNDSKQYYVKIPTWKKCAFGAIDSANNFSWSYISSFLAIYLTDTSLIPAATVSLMFLICRFWDAINDPIVGYLADRTRSRWGRYRPWIFFGSAPLFITSALLFWPHPEWALGVKTTYVVVLYCLVVLFYTMVNLTYGSLNSVMTQDPGERGSISSFRLFFAVIGSTLMTQLVVRAEPALSASHPGMGYFILAVIFAVIGIPLQIWGASVQKEIVPPSDKKSSMSFFKQFGWSFKNRPFMVVCILFLIQGFANYGVGTINIYWFKYVLGSEAPFATFNLVTMVPMLLGTITAPFWNNKFRDKAKAIGITYVVQIVLLLIQYFIFKNSISLGLLYGLGCIMQYFAGANMSMIYGMVPDTIEYSQLQTKGVRMDGFLNTLSSFWNKVGITIGTSGAPLILAITGYQANVAEQAPAVINGLQMMKWVAPAAFNIIALICLVFYRMNYDQFDKIVAEIHEKTPIWEAERAAGNKQ